jgi:signal transduction histidine kinase
MLVALALAAAFIAVLAIVIFLPPRPPDVMRADSVAEHFQAGYEHMLAAERPLSESGMVWSVRAGPPEREESEEMRATQRQLARTLALEKDQVRIYASHVERNSTFVFRVADVDLEAITREAERAARLAQREAEQRARDAEHMAAQAERELERAEAMMERYAHNEAMQERAEAAVERARQRMEMAYEQQTEAEERRSEAEAQAEEAREHAEEVRERVQAANEAVQMAFEDSESNHLEMHIPTPPVTVTVPVAPTPPVAPVSPTTPASPATPAPRARAAVAPVTPVTPAPPMFAPAPVGVVLISGFEVGAELPDGRWLVMRQGRNWAELGWIGRAALIIGGALTVVSILAILFARRLTLPIRSFSNAVQAVGVDPQSEPVLEEGPQELRGAARAVNTMQARLRALIADRTKTLAAVAHDMRTPLMRLRLAAENAPVEQRERMAKEIGEVEALVASFIAFARDDPAEEARVRIDLSALLQSIADDHEQAGRNVRFEGDERVIITGQSLGLKRLFSNLVENALKYGGAARITLSHGEGVEIVDVGDDGPGVPAEQRESVFEPFVRLSEGAGGAGLGLPAARSIARAHGGDIVILDAEKGALLRVTLPA